MNDILKAYDYKVSERKKVTIEKIKGNDGAAVWCVQHFGNGSYYRSLEGCLGYIEGRFGFKNLRERYDIANFFGEDDLIDWWDHK